MSDHTSDHSTPTNTEETIFIPDTAVCYEATDDESIMPSSEYKGPPLSSYAATFAAQMYCASNATLSDVHRSITCAKELLDRTIDSLQQSTTSLLRTLSIPQDNEHVVSLMEDFESGRNVFDDLDNPYKMAKYFENEFSLVKPTELFLGHRADSTRRGGLVKQSLTANTFQYISILETLKFIFHNEKMQSLYLDSHKSTDGKMRDYCDGAHFAGHDLYKKHPSALQIQLYFDDLENTNPLGSKTKIHKMGAVYFSLRNLPPKFNSGLDNIHLCLLFNSIDREMYGFGKIFEPR